jgi:hypothetical protein
MSRRAPASSRVEPGVMTRRPLSANNHRLAASVLASVVGARQREAGQAGRGRTSMGASPEKVGGGGGVAQERREVRGEGAAQPVEEFQRRGGGDGRTRGPSSLLRVEEDRDGGTARAGDSAPPEATGWEEHTVQESVVQVRGGPSEQEGGATEGAGVEGEFWTLGSPSTQLPVLREGNHEAPRKTWDTTWPSSAVAGRTNWDQQPRADSSNGRAGRVPTTIAALEPPSSVPAHDPEPQPSSEYASSGWSGQPRTAGSGSVSVSQQSSRGRASSGQTVRAPQKHHYEVINARAVTPPDVSTLLRVSSSKPSTLVVRPSLSLVTMEQPAQKVTVRLQPRIEPAAGVQVIQPRTQEGAVINVIGSEGSGSGRFLPVSMPLIPQRNTAGSFGASRLQPAMASSVDASERENNLQPVPQPRTSSLSEVPSASKGSPKRPDVRAGLSRAVSSVSSTGSTSNSKPAWKVRKEAGPQQISLGVFPEVGPTGWGGKEGAQGQTGEGAHSEGDEDSSEQHSGDRREVVAEDSGSEEARREGARDWAQETEAMREPSRAEAQVTASERGGSEQAAQVDDPGTASVESVQGSQVEAMSPRQVAEARAAGPEPERGGEAPPPEFHADSGHEREAGEEPDIGAEQSEERGEAAVQDADPPAGENTRTAAPQEVPIAREAPVDDNSPPQPAPERMEAQISGGGTAGAMSLLPVHAAEAVSAGLLERSTPLRAEAKVFVAGVGLVEDAHSPAAATGRRPGGTAGEPGERPNGRENEEEQRVGPKGSGGESRVRKWASETSEEEQRQGEREQTEHQGALNGHELEGGGPRAEPSGWANAHHADTEERPTGWQSASHVNAEEEERPFAMKGGWGDAAPRPWSEEAPRRPQKQTPSGSWVSDDSGSVRSVGIDVERWAEEAARTTLCEHEAMLEDSPVGFEGAASGGSGRGGSTGSSSEGGRGGGRTRYRLKMQKFQLAAIKANQTGGGPPTGWEAVPEEGADEGGLLPAYDGQQGKGCVDNHLGVSL